jgi:glutamate-1-semialdehyde 2,1-aminomutase
MKTSTDSNFKQRAQAVIPGGVNSPVRAFRGVGLDPIFAREASGAHLTTTDGKHLIDFCTSFGPLILGHSHPEVIAAIRDAAGRGTSFAVTTEAEINMAEMITSAVPAIEKVRLVNSGTEAVMTALRLARGATGRTKILKFSGCYHGHTDSMLVEAGSGVAGIATASSSGVTPECARDTIVAPYNNFEAVTQTCAEFSQELAAIVVEPIAANMGIVNPHPCFLEHLRLEADKHGALLIFDEVITGFRLTFGGYSNLTEAKPDITTLGKIIGGGLPIGAIGGKAELMDQLAPDGRVYQAGTLSGNPISVASGLKTLELLKELNPYDQLEQRAIALLTRLDEINRKAGVAITMPRRGNMFSIFFTDRAPQNFDDVMATSKEKFPRLFAALLERGIYLPPSAFETSFLSIAHSDELIDQFVDVWSEAIHVVA